MKPKPNLNLALSVLIFFTQSCHAQHSDNDAQAVTLFRTVEAAVFSDPYPTLPVYSVSKRLFGIGGDSAENALRAAARRTLSDNVDLFEFKLAQKLFQPNGICYVGQWRMVETTSYSGLLAGDTVVPAIVRISVMLGEVHRGSKRTLGMAVKLFAGGDYAHHARSLNILLMDAIAGSRRSHVSQATLDNNPDYGGLPRLGDIPTALRIRSDLNAADRELSPGGPNLRYRGLAHLAQAAPVAGAPLRAPHWLRLKVAAGTPRIDAADFRDELALKHYPGRRLVYVIDAADAASGGKSAARWQRIGELELIRDTVSASCDRRLHFAHPRLERNVAD